jgi:hypothetical protein
MGQESRTPTVRPALSTKRPPDGEGNWCGKNCFDENEDPSMVQSDISNVSITVEMSKAVSLL